MTEQPRPRPLKHAAFLVGGLLVLAIPFGYSVVADYRAYAGYVKKTVLERTTAPPWTEAAMTPADCVNAGLDWVNACPGMEDFCRGVMPRVIGECLDSQDRQPWCASNGAEIKKTSFGYEICEARRANKGKLEKSRLRKQRCALALRALAEYCDHLRLGRSRPGPNPD